MFEELQYKLLTDSVGNPLDGGNNYQFQVPADVPEGSFWSVIVYDKQDNFLIRTDQAWPSVHNHRAHLIINKDGSVDTYFGPESPSGKESNWVKTLPGKGWYLILRLYDPPESAFNKNWKPGEIRSLSLKTD